MKNKKAIIIILIIVVVILIILGVKNILNNNKNKSTTIENNVATSEIEIQKVTFSNITKKYENGITTIRAEMINNTNNKKDFTVKIILKNEQGQEVQNMIQIVENLEPNKKKILSTGIMGDYTNIKDIEFEVIK